MKKALKITILASVGAAIGAAVYGLVKNRKDLVKVLGDIDDEFSEDDDFDDEDDDSLYCKEVDDDAAFEDDE